MDRAQRKGGRVSVGSQYISATRLPRLGTWVWVHALGGTTMELGRVVGANHWQVSGSTRHLLQVRTLEQRTRGMRASDASWYLPTELVRAA